MDPALRSLSLLLLAFLPLACHRGPPSEDLPIRRPLDYGRDLARTEPEAEAIERALAEGLAGALAGPALAEDRLCEPGFRARFPAPDAGRPIKDALLRIAVLEGSASADELDAEAFFATLRAHFPGVRELDRCSVALRRFELARQGTRAVANAELHLAGAREAETASSPPTRVDLRARCELALGRGAAGEWRLRALDLVEGTRVEGEPPPFVDVAAQCGLSYHDSATNRALLQTFVDRHRTLALGGLTALDWDGDGFPDILGTRRNQLTRLFRNDGRGGFVPEPTPVSPRHAGTFLLWLDLDGDGLEEIVSSEIIGYEGERAWAGIHTREGGAWRHIERALEFRNPVGLRRIAAQAIEPIDVNGDGRMDLFFPVYGDMHSRGPDYNTIDASDGGKNLLFINEGGLRFREESDERGLTGRRYTYVALAFDFDGDGDTDLFEGNDFGPNFLWRNDGSGNFTADAEQGPGPASAYTMGVSLADYDATGEWSLYVVNMSSAAGQRIAGLVDPLAPELRRALEVIASGNFLYQGLSEGRWRERGAELGCAEAQWAWGSIFADLDGDGDQELFVTNGFTSHSDAELPDWDTYYWRQVAADAGFLERGERTRDVNAGIPFRGSFSGYQRNRLFWNPDGSEGFVEAGSLFGVDSTLDGRCVAPLDMDGDGDLDLAVYALQGLELFENRSPARSFVRVVLTDARGASPVLGAVVHVTAGSITQKARVRITEGLQTQVLAELHFGLGDAERVERLVVDWPSGRSESWSDLPVDRRLELREGRREVREAALARWPDDARPRPLTASQSAALAALAGGEELPAAATADAATLAERVGVDAAGASFVLDAEGRLARVFWGGASQGETAAAMRDLGEEDPYPDHLLEYGRLQLEEHRYRIALDAFERALAVDPRMAAAAEGIARAHVAMGRLDLAAEAYARSVAIDPDYGLGHFNLGVTLVQLGQLEEALGPFDEALRVRGEDLVTLLALAEAAAVSGDLARALEATDRARRAHETSLEATLLHGKVSARLERWREARASFERALELDPRSAEARAALEAVRGRVGGE